ncbi:MAG: PAS domain S-box protein [Spirochaetes bacterium]|nr:PAS domain S-box protein [Spirochaetota bacterium]
MTLEPNPHDLVLVSAIALLFAAIAISWRQTRRLLRSQTALQEAHAFSERMLETADAMVVGLDLGGRVVLFNRAAEEITGYLRGEMLGTDWIRAAVPPDLAPRASQAFQKIAQGDPLRHFEGPIQTKSGQIRTLSWRNSHLVREGKVVGTLSFGIDITDRIAVEERLRKRERDLKAQRDLLQAISLFQNRLFLLDEGQIAGCILEFLQNFTPRPGCLLLRAETGSYHCFARSPGRDHHCAGQRSDLRGTPLHDAILNREPFYSSNLQDFPPMGQKGCDCLDHDPIRALLCVPIVFEEECLGILFAAAEEVDGITVELRAILPLLTSTVRLAITKARLYENLVRNESRFRILLESAPDAILMFDPENGEIRDANPSAIALFGYGSREAFDAASKKDAPGSAVREFLANCLDVILEERPAPFITPIQDRQGAIIPCEIRVVRLPAVGRGVLRLSLLDVRERESLEAERRQHATQLLENDKILALGTLAAGMAHEITQPLQGISMACETLRKRLSRGPADGALFDGKLAHVEGYVARIQRLIEHVRAFSRERRGEPPRPFDPRESLEGATSLMAAQFARHQVAFAVRAEETPLRVLGNPFDLEQVLLNLLTNAKDAVETRARAGAVEYRPSVELRLARDGQRVLCEIRDNGVGIPPAIRHRLFEPFFTTKPVGQGTGLGLALCQGIIKDMGGTIDIESAADGPTLVRISLPEAP